MVSRFISACAPEAFLNSLTPSIYEACREGFKGFGGVLEEPGGGSGGCGGTPDGFDKTGWGATDAPCNRYDKRVLVASDKA